MLKLVSPHQMIGSAIRSLSEEGGSTEESISRFIRSNYDGIPWGHDRLLPYYLNKFTDVAELVSVTPGRYAIIPQQFQQGEGEGEGEGEEKLYDEERSDLDEGWPIHCEGDLVKWVEALSKSPTGPKPIEEHQKKPKRRGRPPKKMGPTETVEPIDYLQVDNVEPGEPEEEHKRRGRPPKKKQKQKQQNIEAVGPTESGHWAGLSLISSKPMGLKSDVVESKRCPQEKWKRRGRSPKRQQHQLQHKGVVGPNEESIDKGTSALSYKPMGHESPWAGEDDPAATPQETSGKRRGRPPKPKPQVLDS